MATESIDEERPHAADIPAQANLGSGDDYRRGWLNVDVSPNATCDEVVDLDERPWPWPDDAFDVVLLRHTLEHLEDVPDAMREAARIVAPDGEVRVRLPLGKNARVDSTHTFPPTWRSPEQWTHDAAPHTQAPLRLRNRFVSFHCHSPLRSLTRTIDRLGRRYPQLVEDLPTVSGEVEAIYEPVGGR